MNDPGSVTHWINEIKVGKEGIAQQELWNKYFTSLLHVARRRLENLGDQIADEEDVVVSAFESFLQGVTKNRFPQLHDRTHLWPLLVTITARKALNQKRRTAALKRGGGKVRRETDFERNDSNSPFTIEQIAGNEPTPALALEVAEECERRLNSLNEDLRDVAIRKLQGYTNREIAQHFGVIVETIERRLRRIREIWTRQDDHD